MPHAQQVAVAALPHTAVDAKRPGTVVNATHNRPLRRHQALHLEGEVIEEGGVALPFRPLPVAGLAEEAHPFLKEDVEPGSQPQTRTDAQGDLPEGLGRGFGIGHRLVVRAPRLPSRLVAQQIGIQLNGERPAIDQAALHPHPHQVFRPGVAIEEEGVPEVGRGHLTRPTGEGPGVGLPLGDRRQHGRAAEGLRWRQGGGGRHRQVEILGTAIQVEHAVDVLQLTNALKQAVAQAAGLEKLLAALKAHVTGGEQRAAGGIKLNALRLEAPTGDLGGDVARAHVSLKLGVVLLVVARQLQFQGDGLLGARFGEGGQGLPLGRTGGPGCGFSGGGGRGQSGPRRCLRKRRLRRCALPRGGSDEGRELHGERRAHGPEWVALWRALHRGLRRGLLSAGCHLRGGPLLGLRLGQGDRWSQRCVEARDGSRGFAGQGGLLIRPQDSSQQEEKHSCGDLPTLPSGGVRLRWVRRLAMEHHLRPALSKCE